MHKALRGLLAGMIFLCMVRCSFACCLPCMAACKHHVSTVALHYARHRIWLPLREVPKPAMGLWKHAWGCAQGPKGARRAKGEPEDAVYDFKDRINFSVFPSLQGGPHNHQARARLRRSLCSAVEGPCLMHSCSGVVLDL